MCGIVGGVAERNISEILIEGLKRLEYRGYDSAGLALISQGQVLRERRVGKVVNLEEAVKSHQVWEPRDCAYPLGNAWETNRNQCASAYFRQSCCRA